MGADINVDRCGSSKAAQLQQFDLIVIGSRPAGRGLLVSIPAAVYRDNDEYTCNLRIRHSRIASASHSPKAADRITAAL
jgi:hypothetical protein